MVKRGYLRKTFLDSGEPGHNAVLANLWTFAFAADEDGRRKSCSGHTSLVLNSASMVLQTLSIVVQRKDGIIPLFIAIQQA